MKEEPNQTAFFLLKQGVDLDWKDAAGTSSQRVCGMLRSDQEITEVHLLTAPGKQLHIKQEEKGKKNAHQGTCKDKERISPQKGG